MITIKSVTGIYDENDQLLLLATLTADNPLMGAIFLLGVVSGLRISDLLAIRMGDISQSFEVREGKTGKRKIISMCDDTWGFLRMFVEMRRDYGVSDDAPLFSTTRQTVHRYFKRVAVDLGLDNIGTHSMRKTYAYNVLRVTKSVFCTRDALNHTNVTTTLGYLAGGLEELLNCHYGDSVPVMAPSVEVLDSASPSVLE